jgi:hypothetical protein
MRKVLVVELALKTSCSGRGLLVFDASTRSLGTLPLALPSLRPRHRHLLILHLLTQESNPQKSLHNSLLVPAALPKIHRPWEL